MEIGFLNDDSKKWFLSRLDRAKNSLFSSGSHNGDNYRLLCRCLTTSRKKRAETVMSRLPLLLQHKETQCWNIQVTVLMRCMHWCTVLSVCLAGCICVLVWCCVCVFIIIFNDYYGYILMRTRAVMESKRLFVNERLFTSWWQNYISHVIVEVYLTRYHRCHRLVYHWSRGSLLHLNRLCCRLVMLLSFSVRTVKWSNGGLAL